MADLTSLNPLGRFTGLAETYARFRPTYPAHAIEFIMAQCGLAQGSLVVDVGCGTGIASRLLAARGIDVIGIEPNTEMRCVAAASREPEGSGPAVVYRAGQAESTGLPAESAAAVLSAQAFHWFEPVATLHEFHRILKPEGWAVLMWNERDERDPATAAYGEVIRTAREAGSVEGYRVRRAGHVLRASPLFQRAEQIAFNNMQPLDEEGLLGRAFSASYAPREADKRDEWATRLRRVFRECQQDGRVLLRYRTSIYLAQRKSE
jgi:SAM-dependent methyltransferase